MRSKIRFGIIVIGGNALVHDWGHALVRDWGHVLVNDWEYPWNSRMIEPDNDSGLLRVSGVADQVKFGVERLAKAKKNKIGLPVLGLQMIEIDVIHVEIDT